MSEADFNAVMDVNFMSVFALCQVAHRKHTSNRPFRVSYGSMLEYRR